MDRRNLYRDLWEIKKIIKIDNYLVRNQKTYFMTNTMEKNNVHYQPFNNPAAGTIIMGVRGQLGSEKVYISGTTTNGMVNGLLYLGPITGQGNDGKWYELNYTSPDFDDVTSTSCYGPNNAPGGNIQLVGAYLRSSTGKKNLGFYYEGPLDGSGTWTTVSPNNGDTNNVFVHSTMGGLAVGNYDFGNDINGRAFIYDIATKLCADFMISGSLTTTLYGIWHNGGNSYTLAGGYSAKEAGEFSQAFLVDYDSETKATSNFKAFSYKNENTLSIVTHFEGITLSPDHDGYNMPADWINIKGSPKEGASFVSVKRNPNRSFGEATWVDIAYPGDMVTSANTAYKNSILGICVADAGSGAAPVTGSFCATVI